MLNKEAVILRHYLKNIYISTVAPTYIILFVLDYFIYFYCGAQKHCLSTLVYCCIAVFDDDVLMFLVLLYERGMLYLIKRQTKSTSKVT